MRKESEDHVVSDRESPFIAMPKRERWETTRRGG